MEFALNKRTLKDRFSEMLGDIDRHEIFMMSGSLAYTTALALAPFIVILLSMVSFLGPEIQRKLVTELTQALGEKVGATITQVIQHATERPTLSSVSGIIGFLVLLASASAIFTQLRTAFDKINETKIQKKESGVWSFIKDKFLSMGLVLGFVFLSIASLLVSVAFTAFFPAGEGWIWESVFLLFNVALFSVLFACIFRFIPSEKLSWKRCFISGLVSATFYIIGKFLIGLYLGKAGLESSYGAAGSLVVFLAWVYYSGLTILMSCEFSNNVVLKEKKV